MFHTLFNYLYSMKKFVIVSIFIVIGGLILFLPRSCDKPAPTIKDNGWEALKKQNEKELKRKDSVYFELKERTDLRINQLEKELIAQERQYQKQLNDLKLKYDKEYSKVSNTPIDGTVIISTKFLSEEIDYSKFQKN